LVRQPAFSVRSDPDSEGWLAKQTPEVQVAIRSLRTENAGWRTKHKNLEPLANLGREFQKLAGSNGEPADPAALLESTKKQIGEKDLQIRQLKVKGALSDLFVKHGVKPVARDILLGRGLLDDVDPDAPDFDKTMGGIIKKLADEVPELKVTATAPPPTRSGGDNMSGAPPSQQWTMEQLVEARKMGKNDEINAALKAGHLNSILKRP
jgi:hypothetical protein